MRDHARALRVDGAASECPRARAAAAAAARLEVAEGQVVGAGLDRARGGGVCCVVSETGGLRQNRRSSGPFFR